MEGYPALSYGLILACAIFLAFGHYWALIPLIFFSKKNYKVLLLIILAFAFVKIYYQFPASPSTGTAHFSVHSVSSAFRGSYLYRGTLKSFTPDNEEKSIASHLPCQIYSRKRLPANCDYHIHGSLTSRNGRNYQLKTKESWTPIPNTFSLAENRFQLKAQFSRYLKKQIHSKRAHLFLSGLATGELADRTLFKSFGNLGISHIMAISGFHFAILACLFHLLFRAFLPHKVSAIALLLLLTSYFLFIGNGPSIQRAWIMAFVYLFGQLFEKQTSGLNNLGVALCLALVLNPLSLFSLGLQLSFVATLGILLLYGPLNTLLQMLIPKEKLSDIIEKSSLYQHFYLLGSFFRSSLALTLAVHLAIFPILIFVFHTFQFHSLVYNLFFPFLASLSLIMLILALFFPPLHRLNGWYTDGILSIVDHPPIPLRTWYIENVSLAFVTFYLMILFAMTLYLKRDEIID